MWLCGLVILYQLAKITSYNQPKFCPTTSWNQTGITIANKSLVSLETSYVYLDQNDTIYIRNENINKIQILFANSTNPFILIPGRTLYPSGLFVTRTGDIYIVPYSANGRVQKFDWITSTYMNIAYFCDSCYDLFVTANGILYCSMSQSHQIATKSLNENHNSIAIVAGVGFAGTTSTSLRNPRGIFVKDNLDLYIADCFNHRVQFFKAGQFVGITVSETVGSMLLRYPTAVMVDGNDHLYIVDTENNRIIRSELNGFRCLIGCSRSHGSASYELYHPENMAFDTQGNIYVSDRKNYRIQKFFLVTNTCNNTMTTSKRTQFSSDLATIETIYSSTITMKSLIYAIGSCRAGERFYELMEIYVPVSAVYSFSVNGTIDMYIHLYEDNFYPFLTLGNLILESAGSCHSTQVKFINYFESQRRYFIVVRSNIMRGTGNFSLLINGPHAVNVTAAQATNKSLGKQTIYSSALTTESELYARVDCAAPAYYYIAIEIKVKRNDIYRINSNATFIPMSYIYEKHFDPFNPMMNLLKDIHEVKCDSQFEIIVNLQVNVSYVLVVTTYSPLQIGAFSILVTGLYDVNLADFKNIPRVITRIYSSIITPETPTYNHKSCDSSIFHYDAIQINVDTSGLYTILSKGINANPHGSLYQEYFHPFDPFKNLLISNVDGCLNFQFQLKTTLLVNQSYILLVASNRVHDLTKISIITSGPDNIFYRPMKMISSTFTSELTQNSQTYSRICDMGKFHYETIEIIVPENGIYGFEINSTVKIYGYIYRNQFDPFNPSNNLLVETNYTCSMYKFQLTIHLVMNTKYDLVVTTYDSDERGSFSIFVLGPNNISMNANRIRNRTKCIIGDQCHSHKKGIGLILDDILRGEIRSYTSLTGQSLIVKISITMTAIVFVGGIVNSVLSFITFQNQEIRKIGCGIYLLTSSITSFFTITMFTIKFLFVLLAKMNPFTNSSAFRIGCISTEFLLKIFVYVDAWLNACVAAERTIAVFKGISFNLTQSRRAARRIIILLPIIVTITFIHEPLHRNVFEYKTERYHYQNQSNQSMNILNQTIIYTTEQHVLCTTTYSVSIQNYNTIILFFHLIVPFLINLLSALYIILGTARQKLTARNAQRYRHHAIEQLKEHKQPLISSIILLVLSLPRLIISLISGCVDVSENRWLYLSGYFISFTPSMLVFIVFVVPSEFYKRKFKETLIRCFSCRK